MAVYTVHEPPRRKDENAAGPERFQFVRDGFHVWAFVFGPFWMAWRRLWLVLFLYLAVWIALETGLILAGAGTFTHFVVGLMLAFLVGIEASSLRRWTLSRRGWKSVGVVVGDESEEAERRFFANWNAAARPQGAAARSDFHPQQQGSDVIGLFPEPGGQR